MKKILITGGAGFIGFHLARSLAAAGLKVDILDNFSRAVRDPDLDALLQRPHVRCLPLDLADKTLIRGLDTDYDAIFHFAAIIGVQHVLKRPYEVLVKNVELLSNVIEVGRRQHRLQRLVFASTSEVYAGTLLHYGLPLSTPESTPLTLLDTAEPRTSYMLSKIYGEAMCHHSGLPFTVVRPHNVYGPRMGLAHVIPELLKRAQTLPDGGRLQVYSVHHRRTFCYVDDAVDLLNRILSTSGCTGQILNLGSHGPEVSIRKVAEVVIEVVGKQLTIEAMPETPGSPTRRAPDMRLATELTGFRDKVGLKEGVQQTYAWYRANVFSGHGVSAT
jgi:UDP-glucose 4-epimerase